MPTLRLHRRKVVNRLEEPARRRDAEFARDCRRRHLVDPRVPSGGRRGGEVGRHQALVGDEEDDVRQQGQLLHGFGDRAGDADGGPPRRPAVDGADHRLGAAFLRFAAEVGQLLLDQFRGRQGEHIAARHARHLGKQLLGLAAPRRPDQHFELEPTRLSGNRPPHHRGGHRMAEMQVRRETGPARVLVKNNSGRIYPARSAAPSCIVPARRRGLPASRCPRLEPPDRPGTRRRAAKRAAPRGRGPPRPLPARSGVGRARRRPRPPCPPSCDEEPRPECAPALPAIVPNDGSRTGSARPRRANAADIARTPTRGD